MAVKLRLTRVGSKKNPIYRVVAADSRSPRDGKFLEIVGRYNPQTDPSMIELDEDEGQELARQGRAADRGRRPPDQGQGHRLERRWPSCSRTSRASSSTIPMRCAWTTEERDGALVLRLHVAPDDVGKVIGRGGRIVRALRTVVRASAVRDGRRVLVEIAD